MLKNALMYILLVLVISANVAELDTLAREREERIMKSTAHAKLYVSTDEFEQWTESGPDGELIQYTLYTAWKGGELLWVLREGGHYVEADSVTEFTCDRELTFEAGMSLLGQRHRISSAGAPEYSE